MAAVVTLLQVAPERRRAAALDGTHDAALRRGERSAMRLTISFAVAAKHLEPLPTAADPWPGAKSIVVGRARAPPPRAAAADRAGFGWRTPWKWRSAQVAGRGGQAAMTQEQLNGTHVGAGFQQVDREAMTKAVG